METRSNSGLVSEAVPERIQTAPRRASIAMFVVLLGSYVINAMDRQLFPLLVPEVRRQYAFSLSNVGLLSTVFTLGMAVAGLPTGYLLSRFSRKTVLEAGIVLFSACTVLTVMAFGFSDMLIYRAAPGVGEAMQLTILLAIAANYFATYRAAAVGSVNFSFGVGAIISPILGGALLSVYKSWQVPLVFFGVLGFVAILVIALTIRPWFTESQVSAGERVDRGGAPTLVNRNTILLTAMSVVGGFVIYGYLGMYPAFLREGLRYSPTTTGTVMSLYGLGALGSIGGGWLGDRFSPRLVLGLAFLFAAALGFLMFNGSGAVLPQVMLSFGWGGTIASVSPSSLDVLDYPEFGSKLPIEDVLQRFPETRLFADPLPVSFRNVSSSAIGFEEWRELRALLHRLAQEEPDIQGFV